MFSKCKVCCGELDSGRNCINGCDQSSGKTSYGIKLDASTKALVELQHKYLELQQENTKLKQVIEGALKISDLWYSPHDVAYINCEGMALNTMYRNFQEVVK